MMRGALKENMSGKTRRQSNFASSLYEFFAKERVAGGGKMSRSAGRLSQTASASVVPDLPDQALAWGGWGAGNLVTTVCSKANTALLILLKENKRNTVYSLRFLC